MRKLVHLPGTPDTRSERASHHLVRGYIGLALVRTLYGAVLLRAPRSVLELVGEAREDAGAVSFVRLLGARHLAEGLAVILRAGAVRWAAAADVLHAASLALLAPRFPVHRRAFAVNAAASLTLALLSLACARYDERARSVRGRG